MNERVSIQRVTSQARLPSRSTEDSVGYDASACLIDVIDGETKGRLIKVARRGMEEMSEELYVPGVGFRLHSGERAAIPLGIRIALPRGLECQIRPRSGLALNHGLTITNAPATIDPDFRGEIRVLLENHSSTPFQVIHEMRICQLVFARYEAPELVETRDLDETPRGAGGFGHTGV